MKKILTFITIIYILFPIPIFGQKAAYNPITNLIWCKAEEKCYHEIAHKLDDCAHWISKTDNYHFALYYYIRFELTESKPDKLSTDLLQYMLMPFPWYEAYLNRNTEAYAIIFAHAQGRPENMPEIFREFYDWELAEELIAKYIGE